MYKQPDVATEVTLQPIRRFGFDAAILFSDILVIPEAMGLPLDFPEGGPVFSKKVRSAEDIAALKTLEVEKDLGYVKEALTRLRRELGDQTALIGFAGAPYTLASYAVEGGSSKSFEHIKKLEYQQPEQLEILLNKLTYALIDYLVMQVKAGADAVQLFDSWGGNLTPAAFERFALPCVKRIFEAVHQAGGRTIYFVLGSGGFLELVPQAGSHAIGIDWHMSMRDAIRRLGPNSIVQGNLDPLALNAPPAKIEAMARELVEVGRTARGHIVNVGHGLIPSTPIEGVEAFVRGVQGATR
jgi:uroporphyrinogen decarboxylase